MIVVEQARAHSGRMKTALTDASTTVGDLKDRVLAFARERDWEQFHAPKNLSMALAAEAGELMEHFLWASADDSKTLMADEKKRQEIEEELADVIIYGLEFANMTGNRCGGRDRAQDGRECAKISRGKIAG
mgnify:CR=1 FL=1